MKTFRENSTNEQKKRRMQVWMRHVAIILSGEKNAKEFADE